MRTLGCVGVTTLLMLGGALSPGATVGAQQPGDAPAEAAPTALVRRSEPPRGQVSPGGVTLLGPRIPLRGWVGFKGDVVQIRGMPLKRLISIAYGNRLPYPLQSQMVPPVVDGGPAWLDSDEFDIDAVMPSGASSDQFPTLLRAVLRDRFTLVTTIVTKDLPGKALVFRDPRRLASRLRVAPGCASIDFVVVTGGKGGEPRACALVVNSQRGGRRQSTRVHGRGVRVSVLAAYVSSFAPFLPVVDQTQLTGAFDFDLETLEVSASSDSEGFERSIEDEVKALGLTLRSTQAPREVLVIVSAEPPS